jgi:hypothetical protein
MAKTDALARVAADLSRGRTQPAIQRLSSLVAVHPTDLDLRRQLAAVHRRVGNRVEAGRWAYLDPGADADETAAFERAFPTAARQLAALRWPHRAGLAATEYARRRLETLAEAAARESGARTGPDGALVRVVPLGAVGLLLGALVVLVFTVIGAVTVVQWLL